MRTDDANHILGLRVNVWMSVLVFLLGVCLYGSGSGAAATCAGRCRARVDLTTPAAPGVSTFGMSRPIWQVSFRAADAASRL